MELMRAIIITKIATRRTEPKKLKNLVVDCQPWEKGGRDTTLQRGKNKKLTKEGGGRQKEGGGGREKPITTSTLARKYWREGGSTDRFSPADESETTGS